MHFVVISAQYMNMSKGISNHWFILAKFLKQKNRVNKWSCYDTCDNLCKAGFWCWSITTWYEYGHRSDSLLTNALTKLFVCPKEILTLIWSQLLVDVTTYCLRIFWTVNNWKWTEREIFEKRQFNSTTFV